MCRRIDSGASEAGEPLAKGLVDRDVGEVGLNQVELDSAAKTLDGSPTSDLIGFYKSALDVQGRVIIISLSLSRNLPSVSIR